MANRLARLTSRVLSKKLSKGEIDGLSAETNFSKTYTQHSPSALLKELKMMSEGKGGLDSKDMLQLVGSTNKLYARCREFAKQDRFIMAKLSTYVAKLSKEEAAKFTREFNQINKSNQDWVQKFSVADKEARQELRSEPFVDLVSAVAEKLITDSQKIKHNLLSEIGDVLLDQPELRKSITSLDDTLATSFEQASEQSFKDTWAEGVAGKKTVELSEINTRKASIQNLEFKLNELKENSEKLPESISTKKNELEVLNRELEQKVSLDNFTKELIGFGLKTESALESRIRLLKNTDAPQDEITEVEKQLKDSKQEFNVLLEDLKVNEDVLTLLKKIAPLKRSLRMDENAKVNIDQQLKIAEEQTPKTIATLKSEIAMHEEILQQTDEQLYTRLDHMHKAKSQASSTIVANMLDATHSDPNYDGGAYLMAVKVPDTRFMLLNENTKNPSQQLAQVTVLLDKVAAESNGAIKQQVASHCMKGLFEQPSMEQQEKFHQHVEKQLEASAEGKPLDENFERILQVCLTDPNYSKGILSEPSLLKAVEPAKIIQALQAQSKVMKQEDPDNVPKYDRQFSFAARQVVSHAMQADQNNFITEENLPYLQKSLEQQQSFMTTDVLHEIAAQKDAAFDEIKTYLFSEQSSCERLNNYMKSNGDEGQNEYIKASMQAHNPNVSVDLPTVEETQKDKLSKWGEFAKNIKSVIKQTSTSESKRVKELQDQAPSKSPLESVSDNLKSFIEQTGAVESKGVQALQNQSSSKNSLGSFTKTIKDFAEKTGVVDSQGVRELQKQSLSKSSEASPKNNPSADLPRSQSASAEGSSRKSSMLQSLQMLEVDSSDLRKSLEEGLSNSKTETAVNPEVTQDTVSDSKSEHSVNVAAGRWKSVAEDSGVDLSKSQETAPASSIPTVSKEKLAEIKERYDSNEQEKEADANVNEQPSVPGPSGP